MSSPNGESHGARSGGLAALALGGLTEPSGLPPEIAFLTAYGIAEEILHRAAAAARAAGVTADCALLNEGLLSATQFYAMLADHLGVEFLLRPMLVAPDVTFEHGLAAQILPLAANPAGLDFVLAPHGDTLARLMRHFTGHASADRRRVAITSPQRLAALVRLQHRPAIVQQASHGLSDWNPAFSALAGFSLGQRLLGFALGVALVLGTFFDARTTAEVICLAFSVLFLTMVLVRLAAAAASPAGFDEPAPRLPDHALPLYTVVVPLYRESGEVPRLVQALRDLDYPAARLDIKIIVEANDRATQAALDAERLPDRFEVLTAPPGFPQTKPRALNVAMRFARGRYLVIYDAEDAPEPDQLRLAVDRFAQAGADLACLQARLAIDNGADSWLTRLFRLEYSALFDAINPGLARLGLPIALGGTSNHFRIEALRHVNGWDAWNVTEDIDLGIRLARFGYRTGMLRSTTFEEAPVGLRAWLGQRRRWQKGWMVTLQTHSRDPARLFAELGLASAVSIFAMLCGTVATALLGPFFVAGVAADAAFGPLLAPKTPVEMAWSGLAGVLGLLGLLSIAWPILLGMHRRGALAAAAWIALMPAYLLLLSVASWQALFEMLGRPYAWTKTEHGVAKHRDRATSTAVVPRS